MSNTKLIITVILVIVISFFITGYIRSCIPVKSNVKVVISRLKAELECLKDAKTKTTDDSVLKWIDKRISDINSLLNTFSGNEPSK